MFAKKYTKVRIVDESVEYRKNIYIELQEDEYYKTKEFKITDTCGGEIILSVAEIKEILDVADELS